MPEAPRLAGIYVLRLLVTEAKDKAAAVDVAVEADVEAAADNAADVDGVYGIAITFEGAIFL